jgi:hypothetical protein
MSDIASGLVSGGRLPDRIARTSASCERHRAVAFAHDTGTFLALPSAALQHTAMDRLPAPSLTSLALEWINMKDERLNLRQRVLLGAIDGRRNVVVLESLARALGLSADAIEVLRQAGLISFAHVA